MGGSSALNDTLDRLLAYWGRRDGVQVTWQVNVGRDSLSIVVRDDTGNAFIELDGQACRQFITSPGAFVDLLSKHYHDCLAYLRRQKKNPTEVVKPEWGEVAP